MSGRDVYVAGVTDGTLPGQTTAGGSDVFLRRYDSRGRLVWTRQFGTGGNDEAATGALAARGKHVVVGGSVAADQELPGEMSAGLEDAFLRAYDRKGNLLWTLQFGTPANDTVRSIAIARDGSIFVSGQTNGQLAQDAYHGKTDAFVMRLDRDGTVLWLRQFGTSGVDEAIGVTATEDAVYVTGATDGAFPGHANLGAFDAFLARLSLDGEIEWITQFGTSAFDAAWKVGVIGRTIFVSGNSAGVFPGETSSGGFDAFVAALGHEGEFEWARQFGGTGYDNAGALAVDDEGVVVAGRCCGTLPVPAPDPAADAFARKYDPDGNLLWAFRFGSAAFDNGQAVALKGGDVYLAGSTFGSLPGHLNAGGQDAFVARIRGDISDDEDADDQGEDD